MILNPEYPFTPDTPDTPDTPFTPFTPDTLDTPDTPFTPFTVVPTRPFFEKPPFGVGTIVKGVRPNLVRLRIILFDNNF